MPRYGIVAAAVVTVASELLILAGSYPLMRRHFHFFPRPAHAARRAARGGASWAAVLWLLRDAPLPVLLPLGAALYGGLLYAISPRSREVVLGVRR